MDVQGFVLGADDVLYDATDWRRWLWRLLSRLGVTVGYDACFTAWDRVHYRDVCLGRREFAGALSDFLAEFTLTGGQIDEIGAASLARRRAGLDTTRLFPGVRKTMERLSSAGRTLAVLCDAESTAGDVLAFLRRLGVGDCLAAVVSSRDIQCATPDLKCYQAVLHEVGLAAANTVYVGHDARSLAGAAAAGMRTAACRAATSTRADWRLDNFAALCQLTRDRRADAVSVA